MSRKIVNELDRLESELLSTFNKFLSEDPRTFKKEAATTIAAKTMRMRVERLIKLVEDKEKS